MKKISILFILLSLVFGLHAQVLTNQEAVPSISNTNVLLDGSTSFSIESGAANNIGKGIIIPSVDLVNFEFDLTLADGITFPTYFDGMIVYNRATGTTLTEGNRSSTATDVVPGFYFFFNPEGATNESVTEGYWMRMGNNAGGGVIIPTTGISITGEDNVDTGASIGLSADITPANVTNRTLLWTVSNGTGSAVVDALSGLLTGVRSGTVYVYATATDGSGVQGSKMITVNAVPVGDISIIGGTSVAVGSFITLTAEITPNNASNTAVTWSVTNGTGMASIDASRGILMGIAAGDVMVRAEAQDGSGRFAETTINIASTNIPVSNIVISSPNGTNVNAGSTLPLSAVVSPTNASNGALTWTVTNGTGSATINASGVLTGVSAGTVDVYATATDGSGRESNILTITVVSVAPPGFGEPIPDGVYVQKVAGYLTAISDKDGAAIVKNYFRATGETLYLYDVDASSSGMTWQAGKDACIAAGGRLPTLYELAQFEGNHTSYGLRSDGYWSSTEYSSTDAWHWFFVYSTAFWNIKTFNRYVRCVWSE